jgi:ABC-2 type transport system permease protein
MTLYFIIFGELIGKRIGEIKNVPYALYIAPGLIMMAVIMNAYTNVSSSFFSSRFQRNIEELLVSPTPNSFILLGYVLGGVIRGLVIAILVTIITLCFIPMEMTHPYFTFLFILLSAILFAELGFLNALFARNFEDIMIIPTFFLTPLTYLGGVFYSIDMLSPFWQAVSKANPILYMVNGFRYGLIGLTDINVFRAVSMLFLMVIAVTLLNLRLLHKGTGLKE